MTCLLHSLTVPESRLPCVLLHLGPACSARRTCRRHYSRAHADGASVAWLLGWGTLGGAEAGTALPQLKNYSLGQGGINRCNL